MNKEARLPCLYLCLVIAVGAGLAGCAHKPAYSDMDANKASRNQNQNANQSAEGQVAGTTPDAPQPQAPDGSQPAPPPPAAPFKNPTFLDQATGQIKDLPSYPNANRVSAQIGAIQGFNTMSLGFTSSDPMEKIAAFFERVTKDHKWTVSNKLIDPEFSEWTLKKGDNNNAKVQVKKDQRTGALNIVMVRGEKMDAPSK